MLVVSAEPEEEQETEMKVEEEQVPAHRGGAKQKLHTSLRGVRHDAFCGKSLCLESLYGIFTGMPVCW